MILAQRAPQLPNPLAHRRAPSAPVVVAPTKVPGLLSLSKPVPARSPAKQQQPQPSRQRSPKAPKAPRTASPLAAKADKPTGADQDHPITEKPARGRQSAGKASKQPRSSSNISPAPARRSPLSASPAEVPAAPAARPHRQPTRSASFQAPPAHDPFLVSSAATETAKAPAPEAPQLSSRPTGKLARRRRQAPDSPTPARAVAVPVPRADHQARHSMSRSVPDTVNFGAQPAARRTTAPREVFPVCDDLSDVEDTAAVLFPVTPKKKNPLAHFDALRTAPLCAPSPFGGVFDMSSDEDVSSPRDELVFGLMPLSGHSSPATRRKTREEQIKADFFANSSFQNSPDPEELPVPAF